MIPFGYLFGLPKNYFKKVEFSCKFQLGREMAKQRMSKFLGN